MAGIAIHRAIKIRGMMCAVHMINVIAVVRGVFMTGIARAAPAGHKPFRMGVTARTVIINKVVLPGAVVVGVVAGYGMAALAYAAVGGLRKNKPGRLLVHNRILHARYAVF
jgi:hypothetical protein